MSPDYPDGRYVGNWVTVVNQMLIRCLSQFFPASINRLQFYSTIAERDRFEYGKRSLVIAHVIADGDTCPQGTSNARHVATLAGLKTGTGNGFALWQTKGFG
jgi:hypothetical protein